MSATEVTTAAVSGASEASGAPASSRASLVAGPGRRLGALDRFDLAVAGGYLVAALALLGGLWTGLGSRQLSSNVPDQHQFEWFFAFVAHAVVHGQNPLFTTLQNAPAGVNLMANPVVIGLSLPLTPLTLLAGPTTTLALALTLGLAGTGWAWYWVFSRHLVARRGAAALGGGLAGFAPPMISHANAHPNWVAGFVLPALVLATVRIATGSRPVRDGVVLGLLVVVQVFLGEELLLVGATAGAVAAVIWGWSEPERLAAMWRPLAVGVGLAVGVALVLLAGPLWWQFAGPQSYHGLPHSVQGNALDAFTAFPTQSLGGVHEQAERLSLNRTEENAFLGWPLLGLLVAIVVVWRRDPWIRALGLGALVLCIFSLGTTVMIGGTDTGIPAPWELLRHVPLFDALLPTRFTFGALPMLAALLALATDRVLATPDPVGPQGRLPVRALWIGVLVAVLLPILPTPLPVERRDAVPSFFTDGTWRSYVGPGRTVVPVPLVDSGEVKPLRWQMASDFGWSMPGGYFVGPSEDGDTGTWGAPATTTGDLLGAIRRDKNAVVDAGTRDRIRADLLRWRADVLVLVPGDRTDVLRTAVDDLVGVRGREVDGVVVWDVRGLTGASDGSSPRAGS